MSLFETEKSRSRILNYALPIVNLDLCKQTKKLNKAHNIVSCWLNMYTDKIIFYGENLCEVGELVP